MMTMMMIMTDPFTTNLVVKGPVVKVSVVKGATSSMMMTGKIMMISMMMTGKIMMISMMMTRQRRGQGRVGANWHGFAGKPSGSFILSSSFPFCHHQFHFPIIVPIWNYRQKANPISLWPPQFIILILILIILIRPSSSLNIPCKDNLREPADNFWASHALKVIFEDPSFLPSFLHVFDGHSMHVSNYFCNELLSAADWNKKIIMCLVHTLLEDVQCSFGARVLSDQWGPK